ncbi:MAG: hypothetical protein IJG02_11145, partial [Thermoguttaceae bacterium]|nr:hypothetical protein [Thermoguttaceae bacterium]
DRRPDDPENPSHDYRNPIDYLSDHGAKLPTDAGDYPLSPWFDVTAPGGWLDDKGRNLVNREQDAAPQADDLNFPSPARRGEGFGPAEVNLLFALRRVFGGNDNAIAAAANILWNRSLASSEEAIESVAWSMLNNTAYWNTAGRKTLSQPGVYRYAQDPNNQEVSDRDRHQLLWSFTDPLYRGDLNENVNAKVTNFDFPWRGKTYISRYDRYARYYPTFDFSGSSLRVYDPLGNDFLTGAPRMSENPYLLVPYGASAEDSPYTVRALETLLRMKDYNAASGDTSLVDALTNYISDTSSAGYNGLRPFFRGDDPALNNARQTLTTLSSDIPLPAQIFPIGPGTCGDGDIGLYQLIRRCVIMEVYRKLVDPMENYDPSSAAGEALDAIRAIASADGPCSAAVQRMYGAEPSSEEQKDKVLRLSQSMQIAVIYDNLSSIDLASVEYDGNGHTLQQYLDNLLQANGGRGYYFSAINEITDDLYALLPEDIRAGRRLDLNTLSREASWMGWKYDASNNHALGLPSNEDEARKIHYHGLVERMKFARGLYVLLSALTWQERNASLVAQFFTGDEPSVRDRIDDSLMLGDYFDASLEECLAAAANLSYDSYREPPASGSSVSSDTLDKMDHRRDLEQEFFANRLAQWCVNVVDFCDPDATMTPFFFDSTPMDGWWESIVCASGDIEESLIFNGVDNTCPDFYDALEQVFNDPDASVPSTTDPNVPESFFRRLLGEIDGVSLYENDTTYSQLIANWLEGIIDHEEHDFGFRRVWGMERPDLLLTETLNFHDLGIADTRSENVNTEGHGKNVTDQDPDPDFDQVRRPQGSTYLELYCAANPNIPQSPELYDFDDDLNLWKLDLSRMTPRVDGANSPYQDLAFPVWRIAISASRDPHEKDSDATATSEDRGRERRLRKKENSILERLKGDDAPLFSFQPRQFNGQFVTEADSTPSYTDSTGGEVVHHLWRRLDIPASNILGPAMVDKVTVDGKEKRKLSEEIEIDRVVWMTRPLDSTERNWVSVRSYPDAPRLFWRVFEREYEVAANSDDLRAEQTRAYILPNRYFVIGPEDERSIGSYKRTETLGLGITPAPSISGYYGIPSPVRVILNDTHRSGGTVDSMTPILNPYNRVITRSDGTHEVEGSMRAATYFGLGSGVLSYKRGLNISEPLWTGQTDSSSEAEAAGLSYDPYRDPMYGSHKIPTQAVTFESKSVEATKEFVSGDSTTVVPDVPFDEPTDWAGSRRNANSHLTHTSPIAEDQIFGLGTVPGIRSAFLQRVADPNLPYHPLLNPYLTVDWNMMDLTVVNGEIAESLSTNTEPSYPFCSPPAGVDISGFVDNNNKLKVGSNNSVFKDVASMPYDEEPGTSNSMLFSSRQWGNTKQQGFFPQSLHNFQPNPWARAVNLTWVETDEKFGLQTAVGTSGGTDDPNEIVRVLNRSSHIFNDLSAASSLVLPFAPRHTLGWYNDRGGLTSKDNIPKQLTTSYNWYEGLETDWVSGLDTSSVSDWNRTFSPYIGAAGTNSGKVKRFEHLVWNDAPMTSPLELALVPASAPARFGTEFVRAKDDDDFKLSLLGTVTNKGGRSLGSGTRAESLFGYNPTGSADTALVISPYLNFFSSVDESIVRDPDDIDTWLTLLGHSLNLAKIFEFVTLPSPVNGTREAVTQTDGARFWEQYSEYTILDESSNNVTVGDRALSASTLREPGKINLNTIAEPAIGNVSPVWDALVGNNGRTISWNAFKTARTNEDTGQKVWFQSPLAASLSPAPLGGDPQSDDPDDPPVAAVPADGSLFGRKLIHGQSAALFDGDADSHGRGNLRASMADMLRLSGTTTNRSNVFAVWLTVGYFKVERVNPGVNMPKYDPDGTLIRLNNGAAVVDVGGTDVSIFSDEYKYGPYYRAIYPDGYTYGEELGTGDSGDGLLGDGAQRSRAFYLIDRSVPFDFRRGRSLNWEKTILLEKKL